ncbi:MAG: TRAP transporter small permease [Rhodoferax sp.]|nr:TRAP transporter small permease [Rhodoferax sp.]MCF8211741.1 TRAP transporter small permease [Rhodoferax sp.]
MTPANAGRADVHEGPALRILGRVVSMLASAAMALAGIGLLASLALIGWAVVMRYVFKSAPAWVDDLVGINLVMIVMLATADTLRRGEHIGVDLLVERLTAKARNWAHAWAALATGAIAAVLIFNGWDTAMLARKFGVLTEGAIELPTWWLMLLMPVGGALLLLAAIEALWRAVVGLPPVSTLIRAKDKAE